VPNHVENGEIVPDKPPLFIDRGRGDQGARVGFAARPMDVTPSRGPSTKRPSGSSAIAGCLTVVAILVLGRRLFGMRTALLAAATLLTSWQFVNQSRYGRVDTSPAASWAMLLGVAFRPPQDGARGRGRAAGLAVLSKGPVDPPPALAFGAWALETPAMPATWLRDAPWLAAIAVFLCVALPGISPWRLGGRAFTRSSRRRTRTNSPERTAG
jgi:hypothetical protein